MLSSQTFTLLALATVSLAADLDFGNFETFPEVPKTATINGFADPVYDVIPECAKSCVDQDTGSTPCPYWDTGCLCVMSNWSGAVAQCVAENCQGENVEVFTSVATSQCDKVGVPSPYWFIPDNAAAALSSAANAEAETTAESSAPETTSPETTSTEAPATTSSAAPETTSSTIPETTSSAPAMTSSAPAVTSSAAPVSSAAAPEEPSTEEAPVSSAAAPEEDTETSEAPVSTEEASVPSAEASESEASVPVQTNGAAVKGASFVAGIAAFAALL